MLKRAFYLALALLLTALLCGCLNQSPAVESGGVKAEVTIVVTRDFGKELLLEREIEIEPDTSALDALQMVADVETKYGGGFVSSINGISLEYGGANKSKKDWFFYINGVASNMGAKDYILQDGDVEHWDFKDWSYHQFVPAIIGNFPQPFQSGYQGNLKPTVVVYEEAFIKEAQSLAEKLKESGISKVSATRHDLLSDEAKEQSNLIIIAGPENEIISELNSRHKKLGF